MVWFCDYIVATKIPHLSDNVTINTGQILTIPLGEKAFAGTLNDKGILRNFGTLNMGKATTTDLYTQSYKYHIRGGLKSINTDANNDLTNSLFSYKLTYEDGGFYDGNIGNQYWKSSIDGKQRAYQYTYDGASRLKSATYASTQAGENYSLNNVDYDGNGNIINLSRNGLKSNNTFGLIDNLNYTYNANSNKILKVDDASNETASFKDVAGNDYDYWLDGSLKKDNNKQITQIDYNYLKLPEQITLTGGRWIKYDYDADGVKLRKTLSTGKVTDYEEDEIYEDGVLYQTTHDEGRIVGGIYEYNITDHLGNLRVAFKDSLGIAKAVQYENRGAWGESLEGIGFSKPNKNRYSYSTYENQEDFGINVFDAHARMYDATAPRFWQIDPLAEKYHDLSGYNYVANNPLKFIDPDGNDIFTIIWATHDGNIGHAGIAVEEYKTEKYQVTKKNGKVVTRERIVSSGTYTYYDLWPGGEGANKSNVKDDIEASYQKFEGITMSQIMNSDVSGSEGRAPDGVVQLKTDRKTDNLVTESLSSFQAVNTSYNGQKCNCSDFVKAGADYATPIGEQLQNSKATELLGGVQATTPNQLYKAVSSLSNAVVIKDPKGKVNNGFLRGSITNNFKLKVAEKKSN